MRTLFIVAVCLGFCQVTSHLIRGLRNDLTHCQKKAVDEGEDLHMDVVYTYVNGNDPGFLKEKKSHEHAKKDKTDKKNKATRTSDAINTRRFTDHDELRMSIRSVLKNMPWVRCIFIVVAKGDKQVPAWFNADQNRVVIVRHQEIFKDPKALPTYNSHAIEANLYNIKGLARFFLYMNDDFYINAPVKISDFVDIESLKTKPKFKDSILIGKSESKAVRQMAYTAANINNKHLLERLDLIDKRFKGKEHYLAHVAYVQDKFAWNKIMENSEVAAQQVATSRRRFRNKQDFWFPGLVTLYDHRHRDPKSAVRACYIETKTEALLKKEINKCVRGPLAKNFKLLCINDVVDTGQEKLYQIIQKALMQMLPDPSVAEKKNFSPNKNERDEQPDPEDVADERNMEDLKEKKKKREAKLEDTNDDGGGKDKESKEKIPRKPNHHDQAEDKDVNNNADELDSGISNNKRTGDIFRQLHHKVGQIQQTLQGLDVYDTDTKTGSDASLVSVS